MADVFAVVWAGVAHTMHGHIELGVDQVFGETAIRHYLLMHASRYGITLTPATFASGDVRVVGAGLHSVPEDAILVRDDGTSYRVTSTVIFTGTGSVPVECETAGSTGNMEEEDTLAFESPIAGIDSSASVDTGGITGGFDEEDIEDLRSRYLHRRREPSLGGSNADYIAWATSVAGVTRAWVGRHIDGLGTLRVWFVLDNEEDIFPDASKIAEVQARINGEMPGNAEPTAAAPTELAVPFTLNIADDTTANRAAIEAELKDLFYRTAEPGDGEGVGTILISAIRTAIGNAAGGDYTLTTPSANIVPDVGELATLGAVTFV